MYCFSASLWDYLQRPVVNIYVTCSCILPRVLLSFVYIVILKLLHTENESGWTILANNHSAIWKSHFYYEGQRNRKYKKRAKDELCTAPWRSYISTLQHWHLAIWQLLFSSSYLICLAKKSSQLHFANTVETVKLMPVIHQAISYFYVFQVYPLLALSLGLSCANIVVGSATTCPFSHRLSLTLTSGGFIGRTRNVRHSESAISWTLTR